MNFSGFFILAFAAVFVCLTATSFADYADSEAALQAANRSFEGKNIGSAGEELKKRYLEALKQFYKSEDIILNQIEETKRGKDAKSLPEGFKSSLSVILGAAVYAFEIHGIILGLSNNNAKPGLETSSRQTQIGGLKAFDAINIGQNLINYRLQLGGEVPEALLNATETIIRNGFQVGFPIILKGINEAIQALEKAQTNSDQNENAESENCAKRLIDPVSLLAKGEIEKASNESLERGADKELLETYKQTVLCSIADFMDLARYGKQFTEDLDLSEDSAVLSYMKQAKDVEDAIHNITTQLFVPIGYIAEKIDKISSEDIKAAIAEITEGKLNCFLAVKTVADLISIGEGKESLIKTQDYAIEVFVQPIVNAFKTVTNVL